MEEREGRKKGRFKYLIGAVLCGLVPVCCIGYLVYYNVTLKQQREQYQQIQERVIVSPKETKEPEEMPQTEPVLEDEPEPVDLSIYNIPEKDLDFSALREECEDIYAWLTIPDTVIDYPILQHPTELDYYLEYNMDGTKGRPGCIYSELLNEKDFSDFNTVLYGHNMRNGTMFHDLHYYEDSVFFEEHPYIYIYTEEGPLVYEVFAAYEFSNVHLLMGFDLSSEEIRKAYLENIFASEGLNNNFNREIPVTADSKLLTLSTCVNNKSEKRYLVAAVLTADGRNRED